MGGSAKIESSADNVFYTKKYGVIITDSAGNPIKNQQVDFKIAAISYNKGYMLNGIGGWFRNITAVCPTEDFNHNGNLDENEDENGNGVLDPTQAATVTGTGTTDDEGKLSVDVVYPKSEAVWSTHRITATTLVAGTEHVEHVSYTLNLTVPDADGAALVPNVTLLNEDRNGNGIIDTFSEDFNSNGRLDIGEDVNNNGQLDLALSEDINGNGNLDDRISEDRNGNGIINDFSEDFNLNGILDLGEDINSNGQLDLALSEDLNGNGKIDDERYYIGAYGSSSECSNPN